MNKKISITSRHHNRLLSFLFEWLIVCVYLFLVSTHSLTLYNEWRMRATHSWISLRRSERRCIQTRNWSGFTVNSQPSNISITQTKHFVKLFESKRIEQWNPVGRAIRLRTIHVHRDLQLITCIDGEEITRLIGIRSIRRHNSDEDQWLAE